jgi:2'-hydroxyisoflavone reductase
MRILLLGGPKFLGRHIIEAALARGHQLTLFNRGQTNPDLYPQVEKLRGNRDGGLDALQGRSWEAVIDTCGYIPRVVGASAQLLAQAAEHYSFISSISVYSSFRSVGMDESGPLGKLEDESVEEITGETYGPLKVLCEQAVEKHFQGRALHVRAGLIVGPNDPTDRFTYWPARVSRGGQVLAPGHPGYLVQFIDVRELAEWVVRMAELRQAGAYNVTGPDVPLPLGDLLQASQAVSGSAAEVTWVSEEFLLEQKVAPWSDIPLWIPDSDPDAVGFSTVSCARALALGLRFRPLEDTLRATLEFANSRPVDWVWRAGLTAERESELLRLWEERK